MTNPHTRQLGALERELAEADRQLARVVKLLKIADPDGWYVPKRKLPEGAAPPAGGAAAGAVAVAEGEGGEGAGVAARQT